MGSVTIEGPSSQAVLLEPVLIHAISNGIEEDSVEIVQLPLFQNWDVFKPFVSTKVLLNFKNYCSKLNVQVKDITIDWSLGDPSLCKDYSWCQSKNKKVCIRKSYWKNQWVKLCLTTTSCLLTFFLISKKTNNCQYSQIKHTLHASALRAYAIPFAMGLVLTQGMSCTPWSNLKGPPPETKNGFSKKSKWNKINK